MTSQVSALPANLTCFELTVFDTDLRGSIAMYGNSLLTRIQP